MAGDLNRTILIGRLTRDPELRYTPAGAAVASFTVANNRTYTVSGEKKEQVSFFDCVAWSKMGEIITEYCKKGHRIALEGRLQQRSWDDQDGKKRSKVELVVENFQFLTSKGGGEDFPHDSAPSQSGPRSQSPAADTSAGSGHYDDNPFSDDDIPF
ncbi:MAG TPA: single-stranded DNA-binding protein [Spirochaetota bacterium]|nr:single-stranded DNA-binding protein [Spirochaetota bacterium]